MIKGSKMSEESKKKMSESRKGRISPMKGKKHSEETKLKIGQYKPTEEARNKMSESKLGEKNHFYGQKHTEESREKMSNAAKKRVMSEETKQKISNKLKGRIPWIAGKKHSKETIKKLGIIQKNKSTYSIEDFKEKYPIFSKVEEMRYEPGKENEKVIQVHCKNHNCKNSKEQNGWFTPKRQLLIDRKEAVEYGNGGCYIYCCEECKQECPLFNLYSDPYRKIENISSTKEYGIYRQEVLTRSNNKCEYCGNEANIVHHSRPQKLEPGFALDPDFGIACCQECHYKYGHKDECSTSNIANTVCK